MRFDAARALAEAQNFAFDRLPWTEGGRRAVDRVEEAFREAGYAVERTEVAGSPAARNRRIVLHHLFFPILGAILLVLQHERILEKLGYTFFMLIASAFVPAIMKLPLFQDRMIRTWNLIAERPEESERTRRVIVLTTLDVAPPVPHSRVRGVIGSLYVITLFVAIIVGYLPVRVARPTIVALLATLGAVTALTIVSRVRPFPGEGGTDNRDGLGFLVELARTWPRGNPTGIETRFVACGGEILDSAGLKGLSVELGGHWPEKPTLLIGIWSPGRAPTLTIEDTSRIAAEAAVDLWIPSREGKGDILADTYLFIEENEFSFESEFVGLIGVPTSDAPDVFDADAIRRAAQLVHELALRWAKLAPVQTPGDTGTPSSPSS